MASTNSILRDIFPAGADLTGKENTFVKFNSSAQLVPCVAGEGGHTVVYGAKQGEGATVDLVGIGKVQLGGAGRAGELVTSDANGKAVVVAADQVVNGELLASGASGDIVPYLIAPPTARTARAA